MLRARHTLPAAAVAAAVITALLAPAPPAAAVTYSARDPQTWTNAQLAAQVTFGCAQADDVTAMKAMARAGFGGITLLGNNASTSLGTQLAGVRAAAPHGVVPFIASDEEGGRVQRLAKVIYPLPSAKYQGAHWSPANIRRQSGAYGKRMLGLGVTMDLGPVADLAIPGYYIDSLERAYSQTPVTVAGDVNGWVLGMRDVGVVTVLKHWPGHGQASNTHDTAATVPPLSTLEKRDMVPFNDQFARRTTQVVMVGHLQSSGLTEKDLPASESPNALRYLRAKAGPNVLVVTDSLSMAAASTALHRSVPIAAIHALKAGADVALACTSTGVVDGITTSLNNGTLKRADVIAKVQRLLSLKAQHGMLPK